MTREEKQLEEYLQKRFGKNWDSRPHSNECDCDDCDDWCRLWHEYEEIEGIETEWVVTFGPGHVPYGDCHVFIAASDYASARQKTFDTIGTHWSHIITPYELPELLGYGGREVPWAEVMMKPPKSAHAEV